MGWQWGIKKERGHLVRQRVKPAQVYAKAPYLEVVRAARSGGQDVRAPVPSLFSELSSTILLSSTTE